jgi:alkylhydroperoxidase family enzyme
VDEADLRALSTGDDAHFSETERAVLQYATAMTQTTVDVPDALFARLRTQLDDGQIVELTAAIAWENYRARFNHALGFEAEGFCEGALCPLPTPPALAPGET